MNTNIIGQKFSTSEFTFGKGVFSAEISDFGPRASGLFDSLFVDAADKGFVLTSVDSMLSMPCYLSDVSKDAEGEIRAWHFKPVSDNLFAVTIFNH